MSVRDRRMGINKLLLHLSPLTRLKKLAEYSGQTAGIDGHVWLHRSIFTNSAASLRGVTTNSHIQYVIKRAHKLRELGITPVFVFDGADIPAKTKTTRWRQRERANALGRAVGLRDTGDHQIYTPYFAKAAGVSHEMVNSIVKALKCEGIRAHVAPYEADAQLAFLAKMGEVDFVISEDSDLVVYGCPRILFKFDPINATGVELNTPLRDAPGFRELSKEAITLACITSGCDYGPEVRGIGIKRAIKYARAADDSDDPNQLIYKFATTLEGSGFVLGDRSEFIETLRLSMLVFSSQTVFDPSSKSLTSINMQTTRLISDVDRSQVGRLYDNNLAELVYRGELHPVLKEPFD